MNNNKMVIIICFLTVVIIFFIGHAFCAEDVQSITITHEDIINAQPSKTPVEFDKKDLKAVEIMERRHFEKIYPELSDFERLKNLEYELLGNVWLYTDPKDRIERLKTASSNRMITGMALPPSIGSRRAIKRMRNDSIQMRKKDDVGLIDGFLRLLAPDVYEQYRHHADNLYYKYEELR